MVAVYGRIALEFGLRQTAMMEGWAKWAAEEINSDRARRARDAVKEQEEKAEEQRREMQEQE
ncbi:PadR family transcriptional regulator OS=Streptomyces rimosus subsp. rimosus (strain ATCC / DSM 40260 / JCM 4667 / NRRL 2234) OX=1265868 GN=SRIM_021540 PE=4 SV=1 [Streptomyces rimosus subsp. rimosus]